MIAMPRLVPLALAALSLAGCGSGGSDTGGQPASSKVLEGSVSDAMIPYEKLRSEAPPAKIEAGDGEGSRAAQGGASPTGPGSAVPDPMQSVAAPNDGEAETPDD